MEPESRQPRRQHTAGRLLIVVAALLLIAAVLGIRAWIHRRAAATTTADTAPAAPTAPEPVRPTVAHVILSRHMDSDGVLDLEGVLEMFSYAVAPLPGVSVPSGAPDTTGDWGELALGAIPPHLAELSPAQREIVLQYYRPAAGTSAISIDAVPAPGKSGAVRSTAHVVHAGFFVTAGAPPPPTAPSLTVQSAIVSDIRGAVNGEAGKLGHAIGDSPTAGSPASVHVVFAAADLQLGKDKKGNALIGSAWTLGSHGPLNSDGTGDFSGGVNDCTIFVGPSIWAHWGPTPLEVAQMYHEVFHCYQFFVIGHFTAAVAYATPAWVSEGGATWAAASMTSFNEPAFATYLGSHATGIAQRAYDGVGLYFELEYLGQPLWSRWWQVWTDAAVGGWSTTNWFDGVAGPGYNALSQAWGSSFYKDPGLGQPWDVTAPHQTATSTYTADGFTGGRKTQAVPPYSTTQMIVFPQPAGTAVAIAASGTTRLIDGGHQEFVNANPVVLCWDNCSCPDGSALASSIYHVQGQVKWSMAALAGGGQALFVSSPIAEICKKKYPPPTPNPCPVACPGSNGDPHLVTVNLRRLEFQAAGEFTLLRSPDGTFEVQVRQEPIASGSGVTINTAIAVRLGDHRIGAYLKGGTIEPRVDGKVVASGVDLGGAGRFVLYGKGFEAEAPDGSSVWALPIGSYGINVIVLPSTGLTEHGVGVLGRISPGTAMPALPDGTTVPFTSPPADVYAFRYGKFADAWRVTDQTSLFEYDAGKSTASYTVTGFVPEGGAAHAVVLDPAARASAESTCGPVDSVELHDECVFDVALTGQSGFVSGYTAAASFRTRGATPEYWGPKAAETTPTARVNYLAGSTQLMTNVMGMGGSVLAPDGGLYATVTQGTPGNSATLLVAIDPVAGNVRTQAKLDGTAGVATGVAFAGGSVWVIASSFTAKGTSCQVVRMDATTLQVQGRIPLQVCPSASPAIVANDGGVWVQQPIGGSNAQGELWRIDPSSAQIAGKVAVPNGQLTQAGVTVMGGALRGSASAVFWSNGVDAYRVRAPWSAAEELHARGLGLFPAGDMALIETYPGTATLFGGPAQAPIALAGRLVGADAQQLYVGRPGTDAEQLWREPLSGGTPALIAQVPSGTVAPWNASAYDPRTPLWFTANAVLTVVVESAPGGSMGLYLVATPLR